MIDDKEFEKLEKVQTTIVFTVTSEYEIPVEDYVSVEKTLDDFFSGKYDNLDAKLISQPSITDAVVKRVGGNN